MGLKAIREARRLTQAQLAQLAGLDQSQISLLERLGQAANPEWTTVAALARALGIANPAELFSLRARRRVKGRAA